MCVTQVSHLGSIKKRGAGECSRSTDVLRHHIMMEGFSVAIPMLNPSFTSFSSDILISVKIDHLALPIFKRFQLFVNHAGYVYPEVGPVGAKEVDLIGSVCCESFLYLFRIVHPATRTGEGIQGTHANRSVIRMDFVFLPGIKGEDHIWLDFANVGD